MKVLLFHFAELGSLGGVEVAVLRLAEAFKNLGHPSGIVEIAPRWKPRRMLSVNIPVWTAAAPSYTAIRRPRSWASFARSSWQFIRVLHEFEPDIVHVHFPDAQSLPVIGAHALPHRWRLVVTVHGSDIRVAPFEEPQIRTWQARLFARADVVTAVSGPLLEDAVRLYPSIDGKACVIYNGVGAMWLQKPESHSPGQEKYVLYVGRLHAGKGVDLLLRAWKQISPRFPLVELWLAGDGPEVEKLRLLAGEFGILSKVRFLGRKRQEELPALYQNAQAVVLPSRREGFPLTLLEAGAGGCICIGTKVAGIPEIIQDGVNGLLVEPESPKALAAAISQILELPITSQSRMKEAAYRIVREQFSEEKMIFNYLQVFRLVLTQNSKPERPLN
jgi:teichuronic acid biosynthesis glycosyltransferase TuaC